MKADEPAAELVAVTRRYRSPASEQRFALEPASLRVHPGTWTVVTGRSGAGKTTLLQLLARVDRPDSGRIRILGRDVTDLPEAALSELRRSSLGVIPQRFHFMEHLPVWQNVACRLVPAGVSARERRERARAALEELELSGGQDRLPGTLSGGERQRAAVARAVIGRPGILIADEPTSSVDAATARTIAACLGRLREEGACIVVSTHDPLLIEPADRAIELIAGRIAP